MKAFHFLLRFVGCLILVSVVVFGWFAWNFDRPPFELARLQQLQPGMSQGEVQTILGKPNADYGNHWAYSRFMAWPIVYVHFDKNGRFVKSVYDH